MMQLHIGLIKIVIILKIIKDMLKLISKQRPMTKIGTKEKELKYVLNLVLSGSISEKEVIEFACNDGDGNSDGGGGGSSSGDDLVG